MVAVTKEIEKTISPDKVTEMYDKVHEEIEEHIIRSYVIESGYINAAVMMVEPRYDTRTKSFVLRFELNGIEHIHRDSIDEFVGEDQIFEKVRGFYKDAVTEALMKDTVPMILKDIVKRKLFPPPKGDARK